MEDVFTKTDDSIIIDSKVKTFINPKILRRAFVFITTEPEQCDLAIEDLQQIKGVDEVYRSLGCYDIIAQVSAESIDHLREFVLHRIKNITSIKSTLTLTVI